ncbi:PaaI family thioesterase [Pseudopelagicola sp. nBUS_20]|uniref:PaaI family thioesterase n=1 Tax=Pseudopelagicola sp. nBUS_20 TaxID=3395317 RepID=UPI003EB6E2E9
MQAVMSPKEMTDYLIEVFPQVKGDYTIEKMDGQNTVVRLRIAEQHLRPGGTVSGPAMFALADVTAYIATMACIGREALSVTTNCSIDFMRKPIAGVDLIAEARMLKLGKTLAVTDILIFSKGSKAPVARANMTYAIPPRGQSKLQYISA